MPPLSGLEVRTPGKRQCPRRGRVYDNKYVQLKHPASWFNTRRTSRGRHLEWVTTSSCCRISLQVSTNHDGVLLEVRGSHARCGALVFNDDDPYEFFVFSNQNARHVRLQSHAHGRAA